MEKATVETVPLHSWYDEHGVTFLDKSLIAKLKEFKIQHGFGTYNAAISALLKTSQNVPIYVTESTLFSNHTPVIVTGYPRTGKTTSIRKIIEKAKGSILCIDPHGEYDNDKLARPNLERITELQIHTLDWAKEQRVRLVPSSIMALKPSVRSLFDRLNTEREMLSEWIIVIDEAHNFSNMSLVRKFVIEGGKFTRKIIVICTDIKDYEGLGFILRPAPY